MLMVVFGAGASYDSVRAIPVLERTMRKNDLRWQDRPPLADELFDSERGYFKEVLNDLKRCQPDVSSLQIIRSGSSVEKELEKLQNRAQNDLETARSLAAIRYYLHIVIWRCQQQWKKHTPGVTNYKTLLNHIRLYRQKLEDVCLVTFNYDTLLEDAAHELLRIEIGKPSDYIISHYKIIKLHGSINWGHEVETPLEKIASSNPWDIINEMIDKITNLKFSEIYRVVNDIPMASFGGKGLFPAIAIPVETKNQFECPDLHSHELETWIPYVSKLLVIGWKGAEENFVQQLAKNLKNTPQGMIVSSGKASTKNLIENLKQSGIPADFKFYGGGFSDFIVSPEMDEFLKT